MSPVPVYRRELQFLPDSGRVLVRSFIPQNPQRIVQIIGRALAVSEQEAEREVAAVKRDFGARHHDVEAMLLRIFKRVEPQLFTDRPLTRTRQLFIGALFTGEYALESAALFNPSIVPHPDQSGLAPGSLRFILSLRATGEGHISSIEFRTGVIDGAGAITADPVTRFVTTPELRLNPTYNKQSFTVKLYEMGFENEHTAAVMRSLGPTFTLEQLDDSVCAISQRSHVVTREEQRTLECVRWLAESNYELSFSPKTAMCERILFPVSANESNGIEDARFVRFVDDDGSIAYYATYTAYNGRVILPQLLETRDFLDFRVLTLNGRAVENKGMALFPRRINGNYVMLSRQDDENLFLMFSDNPHYWNSPRRLVAPSQTWELVKVGNCGSPIETRAGWLVLTHGVGPMRRYCIGAVLLDLHDPSKVIGRLTEPLIEPAENEREGYVPNVVYTCGALVHWNELIIPYAMSDKATVVSAVPLDDLLEALLRGAP
ncbi:MAG TPA: glycoside hydrolase family 130 protein [Chthoniobacteraceae bacterium]|jgi:predicted GH43/DUF377 family glycosyl hydrolase|nr:glycoside hydrolase family 130 protein [Chthoniobacteraceae bacterium]